MLSLGATERKERAQKQKLGFKLKSSMPCFLLCNNWNLTEFSIQCCRSFLRGAEVKYVQIPLTTASIVECYKKRYLTIIDVIILEFYHPNPHAASISVLADTVHFYFLLPNTTRIWYSTHFLIRLADMRRNIY